MTRYDSALERHVSEDLRRRWPGRGPWDEVWFLEVQLPQGSLWLRYTLGDGPHRRGLATWFVATTADGLLAEQERFPLSSLHPGVPVRNDVLTLTPTDARGRAGPAGWSLQLHHGPRRQPMVPRMLETLGVGRTYVPAGFDLHVSGEVWHGQRRWRLERAPAVLGHIWGASNRTRAWAWSHARFPEDDVVLELLTARLGPLPWLTSLGVWIGDEHLDLTRPRHLPRARVQAGDDTLRVVTRTRTARVELTATLPRHEQVATVRYVDPGDGIARTCRNGGASRLELVVHRGGRTRHFVTDHAAFELARVGEPRRAVLLSD
jgi:hypothetical protein